MKHFQLLAILALGVSASSWANAQGVETGAFVRKPAPTVESLVQQIHGDPIVADRFMRHFHMSKEDVIDYFKGLHLARLKADGSFMVFNVHADGVIRSRVFELKKGTLMFADRNGKPILKKNCANPLTMGELSVTSDVRTEPVPDGLWESDIEPSEALVAAELAEPPFVPVGAEVTPPQPHLPYESRSVACTTGGFAFIPLLLVFNKGSERCPPPVPEPATMSVLGLGAGAAFLIRRRRRKKA